MISLLLDEPMPGEEGEGPLLKTITGSDFQYQYEEKEPFCRGVILFLSTLFCSPD